MSVTDCVRRSLRCAAGEKRLVGLLWGCNVALALVAALPVWRWLGAASARAPETDRLLDRISLGLLAELTQYDRFPPAITLGGVVFSLVLLSAASNAWLAGGVLETLVATDSRPLLHRFSRGAGHLFGRFLRLLILNGVVALVVAAAVTAALGVATRRFDEAGFERLALAGGAARLVLAAGVIGFFVIVLDVARARVVLADDRRMARAWWRSLRVVLGRFGTLLGVYVTLALLFAVVVAAYVGVASAFPSDTRPLILATFALQQLFILTRCGFRVARGAAALAVVRAAEPPVAAPPPPPALLAPEPERPADTPLALGSPDVDQADADRTIRDWQP